MIGIVVIGNEILSAQIVETNLSYMLTKLAQKGFQVRQVRIVRDDLQDIAQAIKELSQVCDHVFSTGGVGPTHDDITLEAYAIAFEQRLVLHPELVQKLESFYEKPLQESQKRMALVPEKTRLVAETERSWPTPLVQNCFALPGLPEIFVKKFDAVLELLPEQSTLFYGHILTSQHETEFAAFLTQVQSDSPAVEIGSYPKMGGSYRTKITLKGRELSAVEQTWKRLKAHFEQNVTLVGEHQPAPYDPNNRSAHT